MGGVNSRSEIEGVSIRPLKRLADDRGAVMHMLRADAPHFETFGEIYFSLVRKGVVKAWKRHRSMTQNFAVPVGQIRLVIYDDRERSQTRGALQVIDTGFDSYALVRIPPMVWYGFKGTGQGDSLIANCATIPHNPDEVENLPYDSGAVPYSWTGELAP